MVTWDYHKLPNGRYLQVRWPIEPLKSELSEEDFFNEFTKAIKQKKFDVVFMKAGWKKPIRYVFIGKNLDGSGSVLCPEYLYALEGKEATHCKKILKVNKLLPKSKKEEA